MRQWRNGAGNAPRHYAGTRSATGCALSRTRSLTAAAIAVAMMATVAVTSLLPTYSAKADEIPGSIYKPANITMGDSGASVNEADTGLATFVGRDFYVGRPKPGDTQQLTESSIEGSWAAEMEGQTFIRGRYMQRAQKGFFTIGTVAFGAQYLPANNADVLVVEGKHSAFGEGVQSKVQTWPSSSSGVDSKGGGVLQTTRTIDGTSTLTNFSTMFAGNCTTVWGNGISCAADKTGVQKNSVYMYGDSSGQPDRQATWGVTDFSQAKDGQGNSIDDYATTIMTPISTMAAGIKANGTVTVDNAPAQNGYVRYKYDYNQYAERAGDVTSKPYAPTKTGTGAFNTYKATMNFGDGGNSEKLITFTGTGNDSDTTQVFTLTAQQLTALNDTNASIWFRNIPENASIIINVTGSDAITMRTGWRFWWGGDSTQSDPTASGAKEISNGYASGDSNNKLYSKVAQKILWNFTGTSSLTIHGAKATNVTVNRKHADQGDWYVNPTETAICTSAYVNDDPSAAMLGSIVVPNGSFESHVTTNGRVYVGKDFMMHNPDTAAVDNQFQSASIIDMDQERHNFPWAASYNTKSAHISWQKVDYSTGNPLSGTSWVVYGSRADATAGKNPLLSVTDNGSGDEDATAGSIKPMTALTPNATYYLKETSTGDSAHKLNGNIYRINAGDGGTTTSTISNVYDAQGNEITNDGTKNLLKTVAGGTGEAIGNESAGKDISWVKTDKDDSNKRLAGSEWELTKYTDVDKWTVADGWPKTIKDTVSDVTGVKITFNGIVQSDGADLGTLAANTTLQLSASVEPSGVAQGVTWTSNSTNYATVDANSGLVTAQSNSGNDYVTITACSTSDTSKCASVKFKVTGASTEKTLTVSPSTASIKVNGTVKLTATANPTDTTVTWSSNTPSVATVDPADGTVRGVSAGTAIITATGSNGKTATAAITVTEETYDIYFKQSLGTQYTWLKYKKTTDTGTAWTGDMQSTDTCGGYVRFSVPKSTVNTAQGFKFGNGSGYSVLMYALNTQGTPFPFTGNTVQVVIAYNDYQGSTVPLGCEIASNSTKSVSRAARRSVRAKASAQSSSTSGTLTDADTSVGGFRITKLENGTYVLEETKAPNGYKLPDPNNGYTITITDDGVTWNPSPTGSNITNSRETGVVTWNKVSSDSQNDKKLGGSEWKLTKTADFSWNDGTVDSTKKGQAEYVTIDEASRQSWNVTDCKSGTGNTCFAPAEGQKIYDVDPVEGQFKLEGLEWGKYTLVETKAPDGYDIDSTVRTFTFGPVAGSDGTGQWNSNGVAAATGNTTGDFMTSPANYNSSVFNFSVGDIKNQPGVVLPATGGTGNSWIYATAMAVALIGVVAAGMALKVRRRQ